MCPEVGYVNVCNRSHNDDAAHTYSVEVATDGGRGEVVGSEAPDMGGGPTSGVDEL